MDIKSKWQQNRGACSSSSPISILAIIYKIKIKFFKKTDQENITKSL
jgi:hypothetical protein